MMASSTYLVTFSIASLSLSPRTSSSVLKLSFLSLREESTFTAETGLEVSFTAERNSLEVILSTLSRGILLLMFPIVTTTAFAETLTTSPTMPLVLTRTFSPTLRGAERNASILSFSACSSSCSCWTFSSARFAFLSWFLFFLSSIWRIFFSM